MTLGENIKRYRKLKGLGRDELGGQINKSQHSIKKYELGEVVPALDLIDRIAKALDVTRWDLMGDDRTTDQILDEVPNPTQADYDENIDVIIKNWAAYEDKTPKEVAEEMRNLPPHYAKVLADYIKHVNKKR